MLVEDKAVVVFQGDSVTDCGRSRDDDENLGGGYVATAAGHALIAQAWLKAVNAI